MGSRFSSWFKRSISGDGPATLCGVGAMQRNDLTRALFDEVGRMLEERGLLMCQGTIVDATIAAAPCSTKKNNNKARDPQMHRPRRVTSGASG